MHNNRTNEKLDTILDKIGMTEDEKAVVYLSIAQLIDRRLQDVIEDVLSEDDMKKLESMQSEDEAHEYIQKRVEEETGQSLQSISDDMMRIVLERAQVEGIKELLNHIQDLM